MPSRLSPSNSIWPRLGGAPAGFLGGRPGLAEGWHNWHIRQGIEMGRPSEIHAAAHRIKDDVVEVRIAGSAVQVAEGTVEVGA